MATYTASPEEPDGILQALTWFVENNCHKISVLMDYKGGWEGWLQSELAYLINTSENIPYTCEREQNTFDQERQMIDLWCKHNSEYWAPDEGCFATRDEPRIGMELKCGGLHQDFYSDVTGPFGVRFAKDIYKIQAGMNSDDVSESGARVYAIGVTEDENDLYGFQTDSVKYWQSPEFGNEQHLYVLWWCEDFLK